MKAYLAIIYDCSGGEEIEINRSDPMDSRKDCEDWAKDQCIRTDWEYIIEQIEV